MSSPSSLPSALPIEDHDFDIVRTTTPLSLVLISASNLHTNGINLGLTRENELSCINDEQVSARRGACRSWVRVAGVLLNSGNI